MKADSLSPASRRLFYHGAIPSGRVDAPRSGQTGPGNRGKFPGRTRRHHAPNDVALRHRTLPRTKTAEVPAGNFENERQRRRLIPAAASLSPAGFPTYLFGTIPRSSSVFERQARVRACAWRRRGKTVGYRKRSLLRLAVKRRSLWLQPEVRQAGIPDVHKARKTTTLCKVVEQLHRISLGPRCRRRVPNRLSAGLMNAPHGNLPTRLDMIGKISDSVDSRHASNIVRIPA